MFEQNFWIDKEDSYFIQKMSLAEAQMHQIEYKQSSLEDN